MEKNSQDKLKLTRKEKHTFITLELVGAIIFSVMAAFVTRNAETLFGDYLTSLCIRVFLIYEFVSIWEQFIKNFFKRTDELKHLESANEEECDDCELNDFEDEEPKDESFDEEENEVPL